MNLLTIECVLPVQIPIVLPIQIGTTLNSDLKL
jgi:hypothetical protein